MEETDERHASTALPSMCQLDRRLGEPTEDLETVATEKKHFCECRETNLILEAVTTGNTKVEAVYFSETSVNFL
jgi:hypothetical protein